MEKQIIYMTLLLNLWLDQERSKTPADTNCENASSYQREIHRMQTILGINYFHLYLLHALIKCVLNVKYNYQTWLLDANFCNKMQ